ncbi:DUF4173 domain-containing protein [Flavobacteriaceae bacterium GSB9]|nr:DUF4173 domain-containing protein [Flavobacteriaceae bacterium GSB9]
MKKISLGIGALFFSSLFYDKSIGLNLLLFSLLTLVIIFVNNKNSLYDRKTIAYSIIYITTGIAVFFHNSMLTIIANMASFFTLIGLVTENKSSIYINWLNGLYSTVAGLFHRKFSVDTKNVAEKSYRNIDYVHLTKIIGIPSIVVILFVTLYRKGNPMFNALIEKIDLGFINIHWLLMTGLGYYLFSNIHQPVPVQPTTKIDLETGNTLFKSNTFSETELKKENQLGTVLIGVLNILIITYLITEITFISTNLDLRASIFSEQVHNSINALITSILIAIVILLFVFRGDLNFYRGNTTLKRLAFLWIILNTLLVISIAIKNGQYVYYYGLTYKRIGVIIYLILSLVGLITTWLKINQLKNIWFLLRLNVKAAFVVFVVCSMVNWDYQITKLNFNYAQSIDFQYLINLSDNNTLLLKKLADTGTLNEKSTAMVERKYKSYINRLNNHSWQELKYDNLIIKNILK